MVLVTILLCFVVPSICECFILFVSPSDKHIPSLIPRKLQVSVAPDLASKGQGVSNSSNMKIKGEVDDYFQPDTKVRCPCGNSLESESMIKVILST